MLIYVHCAFPFGSDLHVQSIPGSRVAVASFEVRGTLRKRQSSAPETEWPPGCGHSVGIRVASKLLKGSARIGVKVQSLEFRFGDLLSPVTYRASWGLGLGFGSLDCKVHKRDDSESAIAVVRLVMTDASDFKRKADSEGLRRQNLQLPGSFIRASRPEATCMPVPSCTPG